MRTMKTLTLTDPETTSPDLVADNIDGLKALFPEAFTEGKVDFEVLKQLLGGAIDDLQEKYVLNSNLKEFGENRGQTGIQESFQYDT